MKFKEGSCFRLKPINGAHIYDRIQFYYLVRDLSITFKP